MFKTGQSAAVCFVEAEQKTLATFWNSEYFFLLDLLSEVIEVLSSQFFHLLHRWKFTGAT